jgi:hypothetical protein
MPVEATSTPSSWLPAMSNKNKTKAGIKPIITKLFTKIKKINYYIKYESYIQIAESKISLPLK